MVAEAVGADLRVWLDRYDRLALEQRASFGPFAAKRWPWAYQQRQAERWAHLWQVLLAWVATDPAVFERVSRELAQEAQEQAEAETVGPYVSQRSNPDPEEQHYLDALVRAQRQLLHEQGCGRCASHASPGRSGSRGTPCAVGTLYWGLAAPRADGSGARPGG